MRIVGGAASDVAVAEGDGVVRVRRVASEDREAKSRGAAEGDLALLLGGIVDGLGRCLDVVGGAGGGAWWGRRGGRGRPMRRVRNM